MTSSCTYRVTHDEIYNNNMPVRIGCGNVFVLISDNRSIKPIMFTSGGKRYFDTAPNGDKYNTKISMFRSTGAKQGRKDREALDLIMGSKFVTIIVYTH